MVLQLPSQGPIVGSVGSVGGESNPGLAHYGGESNPGLAHYNAATQPRSHAATQPRSRWVVSVPSYHPYLCVRLPKTY